MNGKQNANAMAIIMGVLALAVVASIVLGAMTLDKVGSIAETLESANAEDPARENDVVIATDYTIRSTENISNAYQSGDTGGLSDRDKETLDMAKKALEQIITEDMTPYEKELAVYDWMAKDLRFEEGSLLVIPETDADSDNPYGVLKYHKAVCVGYATTFRLFMQMMGIECMVVHNSDCYHSWNLVKLDGEWYHTDVYSDSSSGNYLHFNLSDQKMNESESWNRSFFPAAAGYKYSYAYQNINNCGDIFNLPASVREMMDHQIVARAFSFDREITEEDAQIVQAMMESIQGAASASEDYTDLYMTWSWLSTDKGYLLSVSIEGFENSDDTVTNIPEEAQEKIEDAVNDSFGDLTGGSDGEDEEWSKEDEEG